MPNCKVSTTDNISKKNDKTTSKKRQEAIVKKRIGITLLILCLISISNQIYVQNLVLTIF